MQRLEEISKNKFNYRINILDFRKNQQPSAYPGGIKAEVLQIALPSDSNITATLSINRCSTADNFIGLIKHHCQISNAAIVITDHLTPEFDKRLENYFYPNAANQKLIYLIHTEQLGHPYQPSLTYYKTRRFDALEDENLFQIFNELAIHLSEEAISTEEKRKITTDINERMNQPGCFSFLYANDDRKRQALNELVADINAASHGTTLPTIVNNWKAKTPTSDDHDTTSDLLKNNLQIIRERRFFLFRPFAPETNTGTEKFVDGLAIKYKSVVF